MPEPTALQVYQAIKHRIADWDQAMASPTCCQPPYEYKEALCDLLFELFGESVEV